MAHYMLRAKGSNEAFKGYVDNPQDREGPIKAIVSAVGMTMHKLYFSVSTAEIVVIAEGTAEQLAAAEMVVASSGDSSSTTFPLGFSQEFSDSSLT